MPRSRPTPYSSWSATSGAISGFSRLARSTRDTLMIAETLDRRGADLVSLSERIDTTSSTGKMVFRMLAVLSEFERDVISERTSMAMAHLRSSGKYTGGFEPYGYRNVDGSLEVLPQEMEVVQIIHRLRGEGASLRAISRRLHTDGFHSRTGKAFHPIQIARILRISLPTGGTPTEPPGSSQEPSGAMGGTHA